MSQLKLKEYLDNAFEFLFSSYTYEIGSKYDRNFQIYKRYGEWVLITIQSFIIGLSNQSSNNFKYLLTKELMVKHVNLPI